MPLCYLCLSSIVARNTTQPMSPSDHCQTSPSQRAATLPFVRGRSLALTSSAVAA